MKSTSLLLAALCAFGPAAGFTQDNRPPQPPTPSDKPGRPPEPDRGPRDGERDRGDRSERRMEPRRDGQRGPDGGRRPDEGPRRDGDRSFSEHHRDGKWTMPLPTPVPTPYIGVVTQPPPAVLSAQLGLKDGFGLIVSDVVPDSPAATAGVQRHDVLTHFNDQQLVDAGQLSTLVRGAGKDSEASLTILRASKEQKITVKIGERMAPPRTPGRGGFEFPGSWERWKTPMQDGVKKMQERMKEFGEKMRQYQEKLRDWQKNPSGDVPQPPPVPTLDPENATLQIKPADILVPAPPGGARSVHFVQPMGAVNFYTSDAKMLMKDETGEIEVSTRDGQRTLVAKNAQGETIFDGPIDTEEQRKALPADIRRKVEMVHVRAQVAPLEPPAFAGGGDNVQ